MTSATLSYYTNMTADQGRRFFDGWQAGDPVTEIGSITVEADGLTDERLADRAFAYFQRIEDPVPELDEAEAPSMSVGDIVVVSARAYFAVERIGFRRLTADEVRDLDVIDRGERSVRQLRHELEAQR
jgi:hypothetical protein